MNWNSNLVLWACYHKNENILKECIEMKYNLNEETIYSCNSPVMIATLRDQNLNIIKLLVNNGADLNHVNCYGKDICNYTDNQDYLSFFQSIGVEEVKNTTGRIFHRRQDYIYYFMGLNADDHQAGKTGITPLMMAVSLGNFDLVKKLVEKGAHINKLDNYGRSAIAYYYYENNTEILDCLFENGAQIDPCPSGDGRSPLMVAAIQNFKIKFDYFLNQNANVNFIDSDGNSVLSYAILNQNTENAQKLIARGADVDACGLNGKTPLAWSVFLNKPEITQFLLDNKADINFTDHQGKAALYYAEKYQYTNIIKLLKDKGAIPTITQNQNIFSTLRKKYINLIKIVLNNVNIYDKNEKNESVIDVALQLGDLDIITLLVDKEKDLFVHTALPTAIETKNIPVVKLLLEKGANVNRIDKKTKQSPLTQAINQQNEDIVTLLLKFRANVKTNEEPSPFLRALKLKHNKIVKMLIENVADINAPQNGKSLLQMAIDENNISVIIFLLKKGADPRNVLDRLRGLAKECEELEFVLENVLASSNQTNAERKTNKTEYKTNKTEYKTNKTE